MSPGLAGVYRGLNGRVLRASVRCHADVDATGCGDHVAAAIDVRLLLIHKRVIGGRRGVVVHGVTRVEDPVAIVVRCARIPHGRDPHSHQELKVHAGDRPVAVEVCGPLLNRPSTHVGLGVGEGADTAVGRRPTVH